MSGSALVRLEHVSKTWPENGVAACQDVSLGLYEGQVTALLGENGAGKSTLMGILAGLIRPDSGTVFLADTELGPHENWLSRGIALVAQHPPFSSELSLWEHAILGSEPSLYFSQKDKARICQELSEVAKQWGFDLDWNQSCRHAGPLVLQKATLTALFRRRPRVLILDEPTAALPPPDAEALLRGIARWTKDQGTSAVFITHKLPEALTWADRIAVLRSGQLVAETTPAATTAQTLGRLLFPSIDDSTTDSEEPPGPQGQEIVFQTRGTRADFQLHPGQILGLTSLRGEGAEALEGELTGLSPLPEGTIEMLHHDVTGLSIGALRKLGLSYVPSDRMGRGSSPESPVGANVIPYRVEQLSPKGFLRRRSVRTWFNDLKRQYGLAGESSQRLVTLSGGNIQKVILAREMEWGPRVLILAEPSWGLDVAARKILYRLIREVASKGTGVVVITSEPLELMEVCTDIGALVGGSLRALKPTRQWTREALGQVLLGLDP